MTEDNTEAGEVSSEFTTGGDAGIAAAIQRSASNGTLALLAGVVVLGNAVRALANRRSGALLKAAAGAALIGVGLRQRRSSEEPGPFESDRVTERARDAESTGVTFTEGEEPRSKPDLEADDADPRRDTDDGPVEIDLSPSATADEPGEAVGPDPEQAQPTHTEGTEPEATPDEDVSDAESDADESESADGEDEETDAESASDEETTDEETTDS